MAAPRPIMQQLDGLIEQAWTQLFGSLGGRPTSGHPLRLALLIGLIAGQAALGIILGLVAVLLSGLDAWLDLTVRLLVPLAVAVAAGVLGLVLRARPGWATSALASSMALVVVAAVSIGEMPILGIASIVLAAANVAGLWAVRPLIRPRGAGWPTVVPVVAVALAATWAMVADPLPAPPGTTVRIESTVVLTAADAAAVEGGTFELSTDTGTVAIREADRMIEPRRATTPSPIRALREALVLSGRREDGRAWYLLASLSPDPNTRDCREVNGPGWRRDGGIVVEISGEGGQAGRLGLMLTLAPTDPGSAARLERDRFRGSFCLDERGRVERYAAPYVLGY